MEREIPISEITTDIIRLSEIEKIYKDIRTKYDYDYSDIHGLIAYMKKRLGKELTKTHLEGINEWKDYVRNVSRQTKD